MGSASGRESSRPALALQQGADAVPEVALNLHGVVHHGAAGPARALQVPRKRLQERLIAGQVKHHRHRLAAAALLFEPQLRGDLRVRADGEAIVFADDLGELVLVLAEIGLEVDLDAAILEDLHGGGRQSVGNENLGHG